MVLSVCVCVMGCGDDGGMEMCVSDDGGMGMCVVSVCVGMIVCEDVVYLRYFMVYD